MSTSKYPNEIKINPNQGGKAAIERLVEAYGFTTRQALADHLEVSKSTLANRYMRDTFPADWIIQCALETGTSLAWLSSGIGNKTQNVQFDTIMVPTQTLIEGVLNESESLFFDRSLIPEGINSLGCIIYNDKVFIIEKSVNDITDGEWLLNIEGKIHIRKLTRIPVGKVEVASTKSKFTCALSDIQALGKCYSVFIKKI